MTDHDPFSGSLPSTDIARGMSRPRMGAIDRQCAVVVADVSASMSPHMTLLRASVTEFIASLAAPANRDGFDLAIASFSDSAMTVCPLGKATSAQLDPNALTPGGMTDYASALELAERLIDQALARPEMTQLRPVVVMFSDGGHNGRDYTAVANRLKSKADVVGIALGGAASAALAAVASGPGFVADANDMMAVRRFFAVLGASMSASKRAGASLGKSVAGGLDLFGSRRR